MCSAALFTGVTVVAAVFLLVQKRHLLPDSELAFSFSMSTAFVAISVVNLNRLMENKNNLDKVSITYLTL